MDDHCNWKRNKNLISNFILGKRECPPLKCIIRRGIMSKSVLTVQWQATSKCGSILRLLILRNACIGILLNSIRTRKRRKPARNKKNIFKKFIKYISLFFATWNFKWHNFFQMKLPPLDKNAAAALSDKSKEMKTPIVQEWAMQVKANQKAKFKLERGRRSI